ncbi:MAG: hypothetical protein CR967_02120 [Proteobacteria bacterium]|nr:MAG: hypothetical protein CR967_02120 [Pseudomonadota bacterium]
MLFFVSCSLSPKVTESQSIFMLIKTPNLKYADNGFIRRFGDDLQVQLFNAGSLALELKISKDICINGICYSKRQFNSKFLHSVYPDDFLENLILKREIFGSIGRKKLSDGFSQDILKDGLNISYKVSQKTSIFKDGKNLIFVKILHLN